MNSNSFAGAPHAHDQDSVPRLMGAVLLAILPATLYGLVLFGLAGAQSAGGHRPGGFGL
ncbi:MAG: hypothetical protein R3F40_17495 [Candidatus Competibacteraceae bacterium]